LPSYLKENGTCCAFHKSGDAVWPKVIVAPLIKQRIPERHFNMIEQ
jgi:hypothetical protein